MIRSQRKTHVRAWTWLAPVLLLAIALILSLAPGPAYERAPVRLSPAPVPEGGGG